MSNPEGVYMIDTFVKAPLPMVTNEIETSNEAIGVVKVSVSEQPLGIGNGVAHAEITTYDEAAELANSVAKN